MALTTASGLWRNAGAAKHVCACALTRAAATPAPVAVARAGAAHRVARVVAAAGASPARAFSAAAGGGGAPRGGSGAPRGGAGMRSSYSPAGMGGEEQEEEKRPKHDGVRLFRHFDEIRNNEEHKDYGGLLDILEHEYWCDKERESQPGGWHIPFNPSEEDMRRISELNDDEIQAGQWNVQLDDPWVNGYLTEDEIMFHEEYKPVPYLPDRVKRQMYYLHCNEGYSVKQLSQKFGVRSERVSMVLSMKRTEPDMVATGRCDERLDEIMEELYSEGHKQYEEKGESYDQGINVVMLEDEQLPDDVLPRWDVPAKASKLHYRLPKVPEPAPEDRKYKSKFVFKDVNVKSGRASTMRVVDYSGTVRPSTREEAVSRTWRMQKWNMRPDAQHDPLEFNPVSAALASEKALEA